MGLSLKKFMAILTAVGPIVLLAVPGGAQLAPLVPLILTGIANAEKIPRTSGPAKKAAVLELVSGAVAGTNLVKPGAMNPVHVVAAADHAIDAVLATIKAIESAHMRLPDMPSAITVD